MIASDASFDDDALMVIEDDDEAGAVSGLQPWRVLVVDDDKEVHAATRFALNRCDVDGRPIDLLSAHSAAEGKNVLEGNADVAVVLLDVVMEEHDAGLKFVEWMRAMGFAKQRIILRTGQPGYAPELDIIRTFDINDYRAKGELTQTRLITAMTAAIRTFQQFWAIESAQRAAAEEAARLRTVMDTVADGLITLDSLGRIQSANASMTRMFGYEPHELVGEKEGKLLADEARALCGRVTTALSAGDVNGARFDREVVGRRKDGAEFPMEVGVNEMEYNGERVYVGMLRDITERKAMERMRDEFVSTVNHELRTPLTSIYGSIQLLNHVAQDGLDDKSKRLLDLAQRNCARLKRIVDDMLDLEKIMAGKMDYAFEVTEIDPLIKDVVERQQGLAERFSIQFQLDLGSAGAAVRVDANRFEQALVNLLSNAAKYSPRHGVVRIAARTERGRVRLSVRDDGPGIPKSFHARIFERFARADDSTTRQADGTGIGLSITKTLVEAFGGEITFETEEDVGTTFYVDLPIHDGATA